MLIMTALGKNHNNKIYKRTVNKNIVLFYLLKTQYLLTIYCIIKYRFYLEDIDYEYVQYDEWL